MSLVVRPAINSDIDWLLGQLKQFSEFNNSQISLFGGPEEHKRQVLSDLIRNHVLLLCEKQAEPDELGRVGWIPVGLICGMLHRHQFNPDIKCLTEYFWWVDPEHRNGRAGWMLFKEFEAVGEELCHWVTMSLLENSPVPEGFLEKQGYKLIEKTYLKEHLKEV